MIPSPKVAEKVIYDSQRHNVQRYNQSYAKIAIFAVGSQNCRINIPVLNHISVSNTKRVECHAFGILWEAFETNATLL